MAFRASFIPSERGWRPGDCGTHGSRHHLPDWTPTPTDDLVEFDEMARRRRACPCPFRELFTGTHPPFESPLVGQGRGRILQLSADRIRPLGEVLVRAEKVQFYQINYAIYPADAGIGTIAAEPDRTWTDDLERAKTLFSRPGDLSPNVAPPGAPIRSVRFAQPYRLAAGHHLRIAYARPHRGFRLGRPARSRAARAIWYCASGGTTRKRPQSTVRSAIFFGYAWGRPAMRALLAGTVDDENYLYLADAVGPVREDRARLARSGGSPRRSWRRERRERRTARG